MQHGPCDYQTSLKWMAEADALLLVENFDAKVGIYLPSKFVDYIWAGKPIVALSPAGGTVADYLGATYCLRADPWDADQIKLVLERLIGQPDHVKSALDATTSLRHEFKPQSIATKFVNFIDRYFI